MGEGGQHRLRGRYSVDVALRLTLSEPGTGGPPTTESVGLEELMRQGNAGAWPNWRARPLLASEVDEAWAGALARRGERGSPRTLHVYTHFAYCEMSCKFCMYYHRVPKETELLDAYADYLVRGFRERHQKLGVVQATHAYCGGGTPSALPLSALERFFSAFSRGVRVLGDFTFEAHPITLDEDKLKLAARHRVNRVSMGIQSLEPDVLKRVARKNPSVSRIGQLTHRAQALGMLVNLDLIQGLPGQSVESLRADIQRLIELGPDTITIYRYQPVARLDIGPAESLRFGRVFDKSTRVRILGHGFIPAIPDSNQVYGAKLWAISRRSSRAFVGQLLNVARRIRDLGAPAAEYSCFSAPRSHVMGFGPGAFSHIYGRYWFYDCTPLDRVDADVPAMLRGTELDVADEWRTAMLAAIGCGGFIDPSAAKQLDGVDVCALLGADRGHPALEWKRGRFRLQPRSSMAEREGAVSALLPTRPTPEPVVERPQNAGRVGDLCAVLGIASVGSEFGDAGWIVSERSSHRIEFRSHDRRHRLCLVVESVSPGVSSYRVQGDMALRYVGERLEPGEQALLDEICARLDSSLRV